MLIDSAEWRYDILEEHCEELESLWNRRFRAIRSAAWDARALQRIDARLDAHIDALALAGVQALPLLEPGLAAPADALPLAAAAASALARAEDDRSHERLLSAFLDPGQEARAGLLAALELSATRALRGRLIAASRNADAPVQAAVCLIAAAHGDTTEALFLPTWRAHERADVRSLAWRIAARANLTASEREYRAAFDDSDATVRCEALWAAARTRRPWLISYLTSATAEPSTACLEELRLLIFLSESRQAQALAARATVAALGDARFGLLAASGTTPAIEAALRLMETSDRVQAALAGRAYTRITGIDVSLPERIPVLQADQEPDDFAELINACDTTRAQASFRALQSSLGDGRWARGVDIDSVPLARWPAQIDLETRWGAQLRAAYFDAKHLVAIDAEIFPFQASAP